MIALLPRGNGGGAAVNECAILVRRKCAIYARHLHAELTVKSTAKNFRLRAMDGDRCRTGHEYFPEVGERSKLTLNHLPPRELAGWRGDD